MGRYVVLLIAPVLIGLLIAAGVVVINGLRQRRTDARRTLLEARSDRALSPADPAARKESSDVRRRRTA
jgi:hypothetical protein